MANNEDGMIENVIICLYGSPPRPLPRSRARVHPSFQKRVKVRRVQGVPEIEAHQATRSDLLGVSGGNAYEI